jgi:cbb3-type cytochrome oxidase cytochrome c subunit
VAGWLGSALGVGMAQDLGRIPGWFLVATGAALAVALLLPTAQRGEDRRRSRATGSALSLTFLSLLGVVLEAVATAPTPHQIRRGGEDASVLRGRQVYIAEGCIHCHSQYVRPQGPDSGKWGPVRAIDRSEHPPLVGNRRQGPDLANVGNRRSAGWHEAHLVSPRALTPGSRMPSYAHLFGPGENRGDDLVTYLASLGSGTADARWAEIATLPREAAADAAHTPDRNAGERLFRTWCSACHGAAGAGDGPLAARFSRPTPDLRLHGWRAEDLPHLARIVRFGIPGSAMPGHEQLRPGEAGDIAVFVAALGAPRDTGGGAPADVALAATGASW